MLEAAFTTPIGARDRVSYSRKTSAGSRGRHNGKEIKKMAGFAALNPTYGNSYILPSPIYRPPPPEDTLASGLKFLGRGFKGDNPFYKKGFPLGGWGTAFYQAGFSPRNKGLNPSPAFQKGSFLIFLFCLTPQTRLVTIGVYVIWR
jgi:hypothetical protein